MKRVQDISYNSTISNGWYVKQETMEELMLEANQRAQQELYAEQQIITQQHNNSTIQTFQTREIQEDVIRFESPSVSPHLSDQASTSSSPLSLSSDEENTFYNLVDENEVRKMLRRMQRANRKKRK
jgi:hypothetical protein